MSFLQFPQSIHEIPLLWWLAPNLWVLRSNSKRLATIWTWTNYFSFIFQFLKLTLNLDNVLGTIGQLDKRCPDRAFYKGKEILFPQVDWRWTCSCWVPASSWTRPPWAPSGWRGSWCAWCCWRSWGRPTRCEPRETRYRTTWSRDLLPLSILWACSIFWICLEEILSPSPPCVWLGRRAPRIQDWERGRPSILV